MQSLGDTDRRGRPAGRSHAPLRKVYEPVSSGIQMCRAEGRRIPRAGAAMGQARLREAEGVRAREPVGQREAGRRDLLVRVHVKPSEALGGVTLNQCLFGLFY